MTCVRFDNVCFRHRYDDFDVLSGASFEIGQDICTLLVDSQCGKTTICRLLTGELKPQQGKLSVDGVSACDIKPADSGILYLSDKTPFFLHKKVEYNIAYPLALRKVKRDVRSDIVSAVAQKCGIVDLLQKKVCKLTCDEQRLVALARGITVPRRVVLFDDFFVNGKHAQTDFDSYDMQSVFSLFPDCVKVVVTSDKENAVGKCIVLDGGKCVFCGDEEQARQVVDELSWQV